METYSYPHQFVQKKATASDYAKKIFLIVFFIAIILCAVLAEPLRDVSFILVIGSILIFTAMLRNFTSEYEYSVREGTLYIETLYGVSKRKTLFEIDISLITEVMATNDERFDDVYTTSYRFYDFSSSPDASGRMCFISDERALAFVIEPNEEIVNALTEAIKNG